MENTLHRHIHGGVIASVYVCMQWNIAGAESAASAAAEIFGFGHHKLIRSDYMRPSANTVVVKAPSAAEIGM